jgi:hypothetical protein
MTRWLMFLFFLVTGLVLTFWRMLASGFTLIPRDNSDTRLLHYFLEHSYLWVTRTAPHLSFWDAPFFYPTTSVMAYSDLLVGGAFPYWFFRLFVEPHPSFGLWMLATSALNFLAFYLLLNRPLKCSALASCVGAYLFSFAHLRLTQFGHFQLLPQYYIVIAVYALARLAQPDVIASFPRFRNWLVVFCAAFVLQLYTGFYFAWYFAFTMTGLAVYFLCHKRHRPLLLATAKQHAPSIAFVGGLSLLCLSPLLWHYIQHARTAGYRGFSNMRHHLVPLRAWFYFGHENWFYARLNELPYFQSVTGNIEKRLGLGFFTLGVAGAALWRRRREPVVGGAIILFVLIVTAVSRLPGKIEL